MLAAAGLLFDDADDEWDDEPDHSDSRRGNPGMPRAHKIRKDSSKSPWAELLRHPDVADEASRAGKAFRSRFRVPYVIFRTIVGFPGSAVLDCVPAFGNIVCLASGMQVSLVLDSFLRRKRTCLAREPELQTLDVNTRLFHD